MKGLTLGPRSPASSASDAETPSAIVNDEEKANDLEIIVEFRLDLKAEDLDVKNFKAEDLILLKDLGTGSSGGEVSKVRHVGTEMIMIRKVRMTSPRTFESESIHAHITLLRIDLSRRREDEHPEADCTRATNHARLQFGISCGVLWGISG